MAAGGRAVGFHAGLCGGGEGGAGSGEEGQEMMQNYREGARPHNTKY